MSLSQLLKKGLKEEILKLDSSKNFSFYGAGDPVKLDRDLILKADNEERKERLDA